MLHAHLVNKPAYMYYGPVGHLALLQGLTQHLLVPILQWLQYSKAGEKILSSLTLQVT